MPQLIVYPHPQYSCLGQRQPTYALARDGWSCATQGAGLYCLGTLNQKTGSYQLASGGKEARLWSHRLIVAETKLFTDISPCGSGSYRTPCNLTSSPLSGASFEWKPKPTPYKHRPRVPFMVLIFQDQKPLCVCVCKVVSDSLQPHGL